MRKRLIVLLGTVAMLAVASPALAGVTFETGHGTNGDGPQDPTADYPGLIGTKPVLGGGQADAENGGGVFVRIGHEHHEDPKGSPNILWGRVGVNVSPENGVQIYAEDYMANNNKAELVDSVHRLLGCPVAACPEPWDEQDDAILITVTLP